MRFSSLNKIPNLVLSVRFDAARCIFRASFNSCSFFFQVKAYQFSFQKKLKKMIPEA